MNSSPVTTSRTETWSRSVFEFQSMRTCRSQLWRSCRMRINGGLLSMSASEADGDCSGVQEAAPRGRQRAAKRVAEDRVAEAELVAIGHEQALLAQLFELLHEGERIDVQDVGELVRPEGRVDDGCGEEDAVGERPAVAAA